MGVYLDQVPEEIRDHIEQITATSGLPNTEESTERIAEAWLEKKSIFEQKMNEANMEEVDDMAADEARGALVMTYSGSLLSIGPMVDGHRRVEYASIGLRQDVPDTATHEHSELADDVLPDDPVAFNVGPIQKSSPVFKISVYRDEMTSEAEQKALNEVTQAITEEFVEVNKTMVMTRKND